MNTKKKVILSCMLVSAIVIGVAGSKMYTQASENNKIENGIQVEGIELGGLTEEEAEQKISDYIEQVLESRIILKAENKQIEVSAKELGFTWVNTDLATKAYNIGRCGNLIQRYMALKDLEHTTINMECTFDLKEEDFSKTIEARRTELDLEAIDSTLKRENKEFVITEGQNGVSVDKDASLKEMKIYLAEKWNKSNDTIELVSAKIKERGSREELEKVQNVLGEFSTNYSTSSMDRAINVSAGAKKLNGSLLYPGDLLSVAAICGPFTIENGYAVGGAFENGQIVDSIGGGICQVSTTLYNAALYAEIGIEKRFSHSMVVTYVEVAADAAIAGEYKDLVIKNNQQAPIYIEGYNIGRNIFFKIYGMETRSATRKVVLQSEILETTEPPVPQIKAIPLPIGTVVKTQPAHIGYKAKLWKIVKENDVEISKEELNKSTYMASSEAYEVGIVSSNVEAVAAINEAIATKDIVIIKAAAAYWSDAAIAARAVVVPVAPITPTP